MEGGEEDKKKETVAICYPDERAPERRDCNYQQRGRCPIGNINTLLSAVINSGKLLPIVPSKRILEWKGPQK